MLSDKQDINQDNFIFSACCACLRTYKSQATCSKAACIPLLFQRKENLRFVPRSKVIIAAQVNSRLGKY